MDTVDIKLRRSQLGGLASPLNWEGQAADQRALQVIYAPLEIEIRAGHPSPSPCLHDLPDARTRRQ